ncbi:probable histone-lysine N-methyltransferase PRDM7 [Ostrinia furnacalis]|uniref:probable histone-lysine N-methyltransferase PRDM7 n=1 Tax=Ostrinia furnacalis TaxID=93504 RepID=UPI00103E1E4B|nr:probable histone-lysine N-methyltransferase PRDM7 [Ostrinia furnacalis]
MDRRILRCKPRVCYSEVEEPSLDEYVFCEKCADFVYEYCSIHGALLVIPDDKVPAKTSFPDFVPRAALTIPRVFLHIAPSIIPGAGLGVFSTLTLPSGVRFGPYRGKRVKDIESSYCWQIRDSNNKWSYALDASDPNDSNWMRYVNCSRHWLEQNLIAYQYQGQLYYRTIKIIPRFTELLVFYGAEFAASLHIDLRNYNSPASYVQKFGKYCIYANTNF